MEAMFIKFEDILLQEIELYRKILELSKKKTDVITAGDTAGLDNITKIEQGFILHAGMLERTRESIITEDIMKLEGISSVSTLSELIQYAPLHHKQRLASIGEELTKVLKEQEDINALNNSLIQSNLEYINCILSRQQGGNNVYNMSGTKIKKELDTSILNKKI